MRIHWLKFHQLVGLEHGISENFRMYTLTEMHGAGTNHVVELVHRFIQKRSNGDFLPQNTLCTAG